VLPATFHLLRRPFGAPAPLLTQCLRQRAGQQCVKRNCQWLATALYSETANPFQRLLRLHLRQASSHVPLLLPPRRISRSCHSQPMPQGQAAELRHAFSVSSLTAQAPRLWQSGITEPPEQAAKQRRETCQIPLASLRLR